MSVAVRALRARHESRVEPIRFSSFNLELTNHCNMSCDYCPDGIMRRARGLMDVELARKVIDELAEKQMTNRIYFHLMGEPLLHPKFDELAKYIHDKGLKLAIFTNSSRLTDKNIDRILSVPIDGLVLSIHGTDAESFALRRAGGLSYESYIAGVESFFRKKVEQGHQGKVTMSYMMGDVRTGSPGDQLIVSKEQAEALIQSWRKFFVNLDPGGTASITPVPVNPANFGRDYPLYPGVSLLLKASGLWDGSMVKEGYELRPSLTGYCERISGKAVQGTFAVLWDGTVTYCCSDYEGKLNLGNAREQTIEEIFRGPKATAIRENELRGKLIHPTCQRCKGQIIDISKQRKVPKYRSGASLLYLASSFYRKNGFRRTVQRSIDYLRKAY